MSPAETIHLEDMPADLVATQSGEGAGMTEGVLSSEVTMNWQVALKKSIDKRLSKGEDNILDTIMPEFEKIIISSALAHTGGRKQDAATLLGWGRNTLTRKIKELEIN
jgi:two-component system nitrogen regulation response regulator GlnG